MFAGDDRDGTIGTMAVAALGYLDISIMAGSGEMAMTITGRNISLAQLAQQLLVVELAVKLIDLRDLFLQLILITLRKTAHHIELLQPSFLLALYKLKDGIDALLLGILNKTTSIDDGYLALRTLRVVHAMIAVGFKLFHQQFAVHQILGTAHGDDIYRILFHFPFLNKESTNSTLLNNCRSSIPSPRPMYFTGTLS